MSDFLFTRDEQALHQLAQPLTDIMPEPELVIVKEYSGSWGALAVSLGPYNGFEPYEDESYICVVIGGPVLYWRDNSFLTDQKQSTEATQAILKRWQGGTADWSEDLSGPFVVFIVNKNTCEIFCYTDLMMFIPVYQNAAERVFCLGTHVDTVAKISEQEKNIDEISVVDFILNGIVTYPHTIYTDLYQLAPATKHSWNLESNKNIEQRIPYWEPLEVNPYGNVNEAAAALLAGLIGYIERVTDKMTEVGQFISAGEDSRSIAGMLPKRLERHAYIFVDSKNREFNLAERVADIYGCKFNYILRSPKHYLDILPVASKLVGSGQQYTHAHSLKLAKQSGTDKHLAVFGGFASDALLKGYNVKKSRVSSKFPFIPEFFMQGIDKNISNEKTISDVIINKINLRRSEFFKNIEKLRQRSAYEWFSLWPMTMNTDMPNLTTNRRLFASYEVFTSKEVVKVSAAVPTQWKLNRILFNKAVKPALKDSKWIPHSDGRLPYYPWYLNSFLQLPRWSERIFNKIFNIKEVDGSWTNWTQLSKAIDIMIEDNIRNKSLEFESIKSMEFESLFLVQRINLLTVLNFINK